MSVLRVILAIIFPPLAVIGRGCGSFIIVFILTLLGWIPGVIAALIINQKSPEIHFGFHIHLVIFIFLIINLFALP